MNMPSFRVLLQKLSVLRHNSSLLVAVIIAVVAVVLFIPTQLISSKLKGQIEDDSLQKARAVQNMGALSREQWKEEEKYQQSYENDANQIQQLAKNSSKRELLSYKIFPETKDESALIFEEFGDRFRKGVDELIAGLNATDCPSEAELQKNLQSSSTSSRSRGRSSLQRNLYSFGPYLRGRSFGISSDIDATIMDQICREKANSASVYTHPADMSGYEFWREYEHPGRDEAVKDCWYWQLGYWVIGDVIDTIAACNAGSKSVFTSPVKRLIRVGFALSDRMARRSRRSMRGWGSARKSSEDKPSYILSVQDGLTESCTGRFSNEDIDIIHFNVVVLVRAEAVLPFMQKLCSAKEHKFKGWDGQLVQPETYKHNQITILESDIKPVEREMPEHTLYRYGEDAVVELELICEYIFNKAGYDEVQPDTIKEELKGEEDEQ